MRTRFSVVTLTLLNVLLLVGADVGRTQVRPKMTSAEILATLKPGQWVKLEGIVQNDLTVLCTEVKFLTGDFLDDDWSISAVIRKIDTEKQQAEVLGLPIKIDKDAEFQSEDKSLKSFANLKVGMLLDVDGTYLKDGTFLAKEVEDESPKLAEDAGAAQEVEAKGKVEKFDSSKRTITLMGITFQLTDKTKGKSVIN